MDAAGVAEFFASFLLFSTKWLQPLASYARTRHLLRLPVSKFYIGQKRVVTFLCPVHDLKVDVQEDATHFVS